MNITLKSWLLLIITLILGVVIGSLTTLSVGKAMFHHAKGYHDGGRGYHHGKSHGWKGGHHWKDKKQHHKMMLKKMKHKLDLSESQMEKINPLLEIHSAKFHQAMMSAKDSMQVLFEDFQGDIKPHLNEEQVQKLEKMMERMKKGHHGRWGKYHGKKPQGDNEADEP